MKKLIAFLLLSVAIGSPAYALLKAAAGGGGGGGGGNVSISAGSPNIVVSPSPLTGTGTIGTTNPIDAQTGTSYTILSTDMGETVTFNNSSAVAVTLPQAGTAGFASGVSFSACNEGAGTVTITPTTSIIMGSSSRALTQNQCAYVFSDGTNWPGLMTAIGVSGSGTVNSGSSGQVAYYGSTGTAVSGEALTALIDSSIGSTQGDVLYRGASSWSVLAPGTSGYFLQTQGSAANPQWAAASGSGTVTSITIGTGLSSTQSPLTSSGTMSASTNTRARNISFTFDGGGSALTAGKIIYLSNIPYGGTITGNTLMSDQSCSATIDVWETTAGNVPTVANTIVASDKPTLSSTQTSNDTTLTGWTTSITAGNTMAAKLSTSATCQFINLTLQVTTN